MYESQRLQYQAHRKDNIIKELLPYGLFTVNEAREILNLPAVEDGDKRLQTLNVVSADLADKYQLEGDLDNEGTKDEKDPEQIIKELEAELDKEEEADEGN